MSPDPPAISPRDRAIIRDFATRVAAIAALPVQAERKRLWTLHNSLKRPRPMILVFPEGSWREIMLDSALACEGARARGIERGLRIQIYQHEHFDTDNIIEGVWRVAKAISVSGWGLDPKWHRSDQATGARGFDPVITGPADLKKLKFPEVSYDEEASLRSLQEVHELVGDIMPVKLVGVSHVSFHLMSLYTSLRGLEQVMLDMYENPSMLHDAMAFLEEGNRRIVQQYIDLNLLSLNNDNTYHSSGGNGFTTDLPKLGFNPDRVRPCDMWASAEAQELAQVSPAMHVEFSMQYEKRLLEPFGLNGYGCCEDLTRKLDDVLAIPNIRRISLSPWADVEACARKLGDKYIFSWKPHPAHLAGTFDPAMVKDYIRHALEATKNCVFEIILKDTHTCDNQPQRFDQWTRIARELVDMMHY